MLIRVPAPTRAVRVARSFRAIRVAMSSHVVISSRVVRAVMLSRAVRVAMSSHAVMLSRAVRVTMSSRVVRVAGVMPMLRPYRCFRWLIACAIAPAALWIAPPGCGLAGDLSNFTASLGGDTAGQRGAVGVLFINNTPFRALLTAGTFDPDDRGTRPDFVQFSADPAVGTLETNNQSAIVPLACGRVFSVGGTRLLDAIERNLPDANVDPDATLTGVGFSGAAPGDDRAGESTEGEAPPLDARIGADFPCNALLIVRLEVNDAGPDPFRVDFSFIPSKSDR